MRRCGCWSGRSRGDQVAVIAAGAEDDLLRAQLRCAFAFDGGGPGASTPADMCLPVSRVGD